MAHVFDYSTSTTGITEFTGYSLNNLFGVYSGNFLPAEYWNSLGSLQGDVSYLYEDYDSQGNWVTRTGSFRMHLDGWGSYVSQSLTPYADTYYPYFYADDPGLFASDDFFSGKSQLTLFSSGGIYGYLRMEELPTLTRSFGPLPNQAFHDYNAAAEYAAAAVALANANHLAGLRALESASIASAGRIVVENFGPDPAAGSTRLVYTPDATTHVTFADWITFDPSDIGDAYTAQLVDTQKLFATEDVTVILTDSDDRFMDIGGGIAARTLVIEAGAGNDDISVTGDAWNVESSPDSVPLHLVVNAGGGDDTVFFTVKGTATITGGAGNDTIFGSALSSSPSGYLEAYGGEGADYIQGINDGANLIHGGSGNDGLFGGFDSQDTIYGGDGDDDIRAGSVWDRFYKQFYYSQTPNLFYGGAGNDALFGGDGADTIYGGAGDDWIGGGRGSPSLFGGAGRDTYSLSVGNEDDIPKPFGDMVIVDDGGVIEFATWMASSLDLSQLARQGNDLVMGVPGLSSVRLVDFYLNPTGWSASGGFIDFTRAAGLTDPAFFGTQGPDNITMTVPGHFQALGGNDTVIGTSGADRIDGGSGNDLLRGLGGDDTIHGRNGNDTVEGGDGNDQIFGSAGRNRLFGNGGDDLIFAGNGGDFIGGGAGNDTIRGGDAADTIYGGLG
ncbi:calcium-binding protein, partial [Szabonella alba]